jgi:hypothetical protein
MLLDLKKLVCLLTCVSLMLPTVALTQCECCAKGCPAKSSQTAAESCCKGNSCCQADHCCQAKCCSKQACCEQADRPAGPECSATCQCCDGQPPVEPAKITSPQPSELQLDLLATSAAATVSPADQNSATVGLSDGSRPILTPLRLHALLGVWLN